MSILDLIPQSNTKVAIPDEIKFSATDDITYSNRLSEVWGYFTEQELSKVDFINQYKDAIWVYACVNAIATSLSGIPLKVYKIDSEANDRRNVQSMLTKYGSVENLIKAVDKNKVSTKIMDIEEITNGDLVEILDTPNDYMTNVEFMETTICHLDLRGNAFWEFVGEREKTPISANNPPREIHVLNPNNMFIMPDAKQFIKGYVYTVNGKMIPFETNEILHLKYTDPNSEHYGMGSVEPLINTLVSERNAMSYNQKFFENSAIPDGVLSTPDTLSSKVYDRVKESWESKYKGVRNSHKVAILEKGLEYKHIGISQREADFIESRKMNREEIIAATGLFPVILGLEVANYATARVQERMFWSSTLKPKARKIDQALNSFFVPHYGENIFVEHDFSEVEALKSDKSEELVRLFNGGLITQNEAREILNKPSIDDGNILYVNPQMIPVSQAISEHNEVEE